MKHRWARLTLGPVLALGFAAIPWAVQAQGQESAAQDWRKANEAVGQFPRGHVDVLRWEQSQTPKATTPSPTTGYALASAADAVRAAWSAYPELASPLAQLGSRNVEHIAAGDWSELDPGLQRWIHQAGRLLEIAATTRKAWFTAVAARQTLQHHENALTATEAAAELGRRMVRAGNWSTYQQAQVALGESSARLELTRARLAVQQTESALLKAMALDSVHDRVALPDRLPEPPTTLINEIQLQQRLTAIQGHLPWAESRKAVTQARQAFAAYNASLQAHRIHRDGILKQRELIGEETLLRYNGMLKSVWDLLADVSVRSQAVVAAISVQRDALIADTDLQWVLQGGQPGSFVSLGGGAQGASAATPGH